MIVSLLGSGLLVSGPPVGDGPDSGTQSGYSEAYQWLTRSALSRQLTLPSASSTDRTARHCTPRRGTRCPARHENTPAYTDSVGGWETPRSRAGPRLERSVEIGKRHGRSRDEAGARLSGGGGDHRAGVGEAGADEVLAVEDVTGGAADALPICGRTTWLTTVSSVRAA